MGNPETVEMVIPGGGTFDLLLLSYSFKQEEANFLRHQSAEWVKRSDPAEGAGSL